MAVTATGFPFAASGSSTPAPAARINLFCAYQHQDFVTILMSTTKVSGTADVRDNLTTSIANVGNAANDRIDWFTFGPNC